MGCYRYGLQYFSSDYSRTQVSIQHSTGSTGALNPLGVATLSRIASGLDSIAMPPLQSSNDWNPSTYVQSMQPMAFTTHIWVFSTGICFTVVCSVYGTVQSIKDVQSMCHAKISRSSSPTDGASFQEGGVLTWRNRAEETSLRPTWMLSWVFRASWITNFASFEPTDTVSVIRTWFWNIAPFAGNYCKATYSLTPGQSHFLKAVKVARIWWLSPQTKVKQAQKSTPSDVQCARKVLQIDMIVLWFLTLSLIHEEVQQ